MDRKITAHFSHKHDLIRVDDSARLWSHCSFCKEQIPSNPYYVCIRQSCSILMHKSCIELRKEIEHPFHPEHPLSIHPTGSKSNSDDETSCDACREDFRFHSNRYQCSPCGFFLHIKCAMLLPLKRREEDLEGPAQIQLPTHPHALFLCDLNIRHSTHAYNCSYCNTNFRDGWIYVCLQCKVLLHKSCAELPFKIHHPFHPLHPLTLLPAPSRYDYSDASLSCFCCGSHTTRFRYQCEDCGFHLHSQCATFLPTKNNSGDESLQFTHSHHLITFDLDEAPAHFPIFSCGGCGELFLRRSMTDSKICFCRECRIWLHKACAELPREIRHPLDPLHPLILVENYDQRELAGKGKCYACGKTVKRFIYQCSHCKLEIDTSCPSLVTAYVMSNIHRHPLALFKHSNPNAIGDPMCHKCNRSCRSSPFFRCLQCELNIHFHCLPKLPTTVKSKHHRHPLLLTHSRIKDYPDEDDNADLYCEECETGRRLIDSSYYCENCHYVAHVHCMLKEVMQFLEDDWFLASKREGKEQEMFRDMLDGKSYGVFGKVLIIEEGEEENQVPDHGNKPKEQSPSSRMEILSSHPNRRNRVTEDFLLAIKKKLAELHFEESSLIGKMNELDKVLEELNASTNV